MLTSSYTFGDWYIKIVNIQKSANNCCYPLFEVVGNPSNQINNAVTHAVYTPCVLKYVHKSLYTREHLLCLVSELLI